MHWTTTIVRMGVLAGCGGLLIATLSVASAEGPPVPAVDGPALAPPRLVELEIKVPPEPADPSPAQPEKPGAVKPPVAEETKPDAIPPGKPDTAEPAAKEPATSEPPAPADERKPELTPELAALRDRVRRTLALAYRTPMNTRDHTATDLMHLALAFGCNAEAQLGGAGGGKINAITALCWNYPSAGREPLTVAGAHIAPRIGFGLQTQRGQLLAVLAQARVPGDYPIRVGEDQRTVADLAEQEKLNCREGVDQSQVLIGLSFYLGDDPKWKDSLGGAWSLERLVDLELEGPINGAPDGGLHRLMALSYAVKARTSRKQPVTGPFEQARQYVGKYHDFAFKCQNEDGSWNPAFFAAVGRSGDSSGTLRATGHIARWLAFSLPEEKLEDPRMVKAVTMVDSMLNNRRSLGDGTSLSPVETSAVMHAVHGLAVYDDRVFVPRDAAQAPSQAKPAAQEKPAARAKKTPVRG